MKQNSIPAIFFPKKECPPFKAATFTAFSWNQNTTHNNCKRM